VRTHGSPLARPVYLQQRTYLVTAGTAVESHEETSNDIGVALRYDKKAPGSQADAPSRCY